MYEGVLAGLPEQSLISPSLEENIINVVEICEIGVDFQNPVWLDHDDGYDVEETCFPAHEWLCLHPCYDIVKTPGNIQEDGCD